MWLRDIRKGPPPEEVTHYMTSRKAVILIDDTRPWIPKLKLQGDLCDAIYAMLSLMSHLCYLCDAIFAQRSMLCAPLRECVRTCTCLYVYVVSYITLYVSHVSIRSSHFHMPEQSAMTRVCVRV